jgi:hypothetical protein
VSSTSLFFTGNKNRAIRHTEMNQHSSRSHAILQLWVEQPATTDGPTAAAVPPSPPSATDAADALRADQRGKRGGSAGSAVLGRPVVRSKLNFVDLAGSERWRRKDHDLQDRNL